MKQSRRARRMQRHHIRNKRSPAFNLVSLMDIFTILVFFLLVNSSDGEVLPTTSRIDLPESIAEQKPRENLVVMVTERNILVQGAAVARISELKDGDSRSIESLKAALMEQYKQGPQQRARAPVPEVTIMASKAIPYGLLKKVMKTCTAAGYGNISLAVLQKAAQET
ncbi:MAG: biopolymer transporter ExbD [Gammaproteobacteria bacterium]|jgi:biopolymer transport protein ExbD